jgi:riboflavin transporter FmnP
VHALTAFLLFTLPAHVLGNEAGDAFLESWFHPMSTVGRWVTFYLIPVLALLAGIYVVTKAEVTVSDALVGFAVGGLVFGLVVTLTNWVVSHPVARQSTAEYAVQTVRFTFRVFGPALVGILGAQLLGNR